MIFHIHILYSIYTSHHISSFLYIRYIRYIGTHLTYALLLSRSPAPLLCPSTCLPFRNSPFLTVSLSLLQNPPFYSYILSLLPFPFLSFPSLFCALPSPSLPFCFSPSLAVPTKKQKSLEPRTRTEQLGDRGVQQPPTRQTKYVSKVSKLTPIQTLGLLELGYVDTCIQEFCLSIYLNCCLVNFDILYNPPFFSFIQIKIVLVLV